MKIKLFILLILILLSMTQATVVYDTGIKDPYQGKSTHNYLDFYTYYAQSFIAPDLWLLDLEIPVYDNQNNTSKNNPDFTVELWDDSRSVLASSSVYDAPKNDKEDPTYYSIDYPSVELIIGDVYWAVYNPLSSVKSDAWCGIYQGNYNPCNGQYCEQYFAPDDEYCSSTILYAYRATFNSVPTPEIATIVLLGLGSLCLLVRR